VSDAVAGVTVTLIGTSVIVAVAHTSGFAVAHPFAVTTVWVLTDALALYKFPVIVPKFGLNVQFTV
jgi:hypothetical protein